MQSTVTLDTNVYVRLARAAAKSGQETQLDRLRSADRARSLQPCVHPFVLAELLSQRTFSV